MLLMLFSTSLNPDNFPSNMFILGWHSSFSSRSICSTGKKIVVGVGTVPSVPDCIINLNHIDDLSIFHSSEYLFKKEKLLTQKNIMLIGSGQSAAEIFYDLLQLTTDLNIDNSNVESISWFTRAEYIFPMDNS